MGITNYWYLNKSYLIRQEKCIKAKAVTGNKAEVIQVTKDRRLFTHFCSLAMFAFLSVLRYDYKVILFCLDPSQSQGGLVSCWHSVKLFMSNRRAPRPNMSASLVPSNTEVHLIVPSQLPDIGAAFLFLPSFLARKKQNTYTWKRSISLIASVF